MNIEGLGTFYLGRPYDLGAKKQLDQPLLYDAKDLLTHAVCVGMTGSGKTGLCIDIIEEAALDGIPALVIDPKGDLANLCRPPKGSTWRIFPIASRIWNQPAPVSQSCFGNISS